MRVNRIRALMLVVVVAFSTFAQMDAQKQVEHLNRGLVAIRDGEGYYLKWRLLGNEPWETGFNVYNGTTKLNDEPITNVTSYIDINAPLNSQYYVRAVIDGVEQFDIRPARIINNRQGSNAAWFDIPINRPLEGEHGGTYTPNDASVGDLTGDGEYEIVLKWDPSNSKDNSQSGITDNVFIDAYTMDGQHLWRIDLGPNIRAGAHYTQFLVYDFDGDGRAEIMMKTAPGTKDATGSYISKGPAALADHSAIYRNSGGYILLGPEFLTVFDGTTGKELATAEYWPLRGVVSSWGNNESYGNRVDRFNATVAYVDGHRPSAIFQRGYYDKMTFAAWDWRDGTLTRRWTFNSKDPFTNNAYSGQGNHSIHVIDANGDGKHDIVTGSAVISANGTGMHTTGFGHGDATHVTYMKKNEPRPMIYMPHESGGHGVSFRYADDGEMIFNHRSPGDIGRGAAAELDPNRPGFHFWASGLGLYNFNGTIVGNNPSSTNFLIWWDGNLSRELLNSNRIDRWSIQNNSASNLLSADNTSSNNGTKSTPTLSADLFGDWREEVIFRRSDQQALRVFTTTIPTTHKLYTFMHDPIYRVAISWQNSSYNQPPHPGFYVATDMDFPPPTPNVYLVDGVNRGSGNVIENLKVYDIPNALNWQIMPSLSTTSSIYSEVNFYYDEGPVYLDGKEWVRTSSESRKMAGGITLASFKAKKDADIYLVHQRSITNRPEWIDEWELTEETVYIRNASGARAPMNLFVKRVTEGENITFGGNTIAGSVGNVMYFIVADAGVINSLNPAASSGIELEIWPNPFANQTNISFDLDREQEVIVQLFDVNGRMVKTLKTGMGNVGKNSIVLNGDNIPGGVYIVRLIAGGTLVQQKIILSK